LTAAVERADLGRWIERYERAWRTPGTAELKDLFSADATYMAAPFAPPLRGLEQIAAFWEDERESAEEVFTLAWEPVAVDGNVCVARVEVHYGDPVTRTYRDLWIITLAADGRCTAFEEWPFFPERPRVSER
jgi:ketosteroid isomerase-like protein